MPEIRFEWDAPKQSTPNMYIQGVDPFQMMDAATWLIENASKCARVDIAAKPSVKFTFEKTGYLDFEFEVANVTVAMLNVAGIFLKLNAERHMALMVMQAEEEVARAAVEDRQNPGILVPPHVIKERRN